MKFKKKYKKYNDMKIKETFKIMGILSGLSLTAYSCVSTETVEKPIDKDRLGEEITLQLSAPESLKSRASSDHKLRYVAKLYEFIKNDGGAQFKTINRREAIESGDITTITYNVDPDKIYIVYLFADYIPENSTADGNGYYPDYYYNTQSETDDRIRMITNPGKTSGVAPEFFNNDNYDCFYFCSDTIHKSLLKRELDCTLKRAVAKIRFVDENATEEEFGSVSFSKINYLEEFGLELGMANASKTLSSQLSEIKIEKMGKPSTNEIFYYYTLASDTKDQGLQDMAFTTVNKAGKSKSINVPTGAHYRQNYITTIKGNLLEKGNNDPGQDGPGLENPDFGDLILNMTTNQEWKEEGLNFDVQ